MAKHLTNTIIQVNERVYFQLQETFRQEKGPPELHYCEILLPEVEQNTTMFNQT